MYVNICVFLCSVVYSFLNIYIDIYIYMYACIVFSLFVYLCFILHSPKNCCIRGPGGVGKEWVPVAGPKSVRGNWPLCLQGVSRGLPPLVPKV